MPLSPRKAASAGLDSHITSVATDAANKAVAATITLILSPSLLNISYVLLSWWGGGRSDPCPIAKARVSMRALWGLVYWPCGPFFRRFGWSGGPLSQR